MTTQELNALVIGQGCDFYSVRVVQGCENLNVMKKVAHHCFSGDVHTGNQGLSSIFLTFTSFHSMTLKITPLNFMLFFLRKLASKLKSAKLFASLMRRSSSYAVNQSIHLVDKEAITCLVTVERIDCLVR